MQLYCSFSNGDVRFLSQPLFKSQSQTISVPEARQRSLQDGCSGNTSHI